MEYQSTWSVFIFHRHENHQEIIDLAEVTMRAEIPVSYSGRSITYDERKNALIKAWSEKKEELKSMYEKIS